MVMHGPSSAPTQIAVLDGVLETHTPTQPGSEGADLWARNPPKGSCRSMGSEVGVLGGRLIPAGGAGWQAELGWSGQPVGEQDEEVSWGQCSGL